MKRAILTSIFALFFFALGWMSVCYRVQISANERIASADAEHAAKIARIRQNSYGIDYFQSNGSPTIRDARLDQFDVNTSKGSITISYVGGLGGADTHLQLKTDGSILVIDHGVSRMVCTLDQVRCAEFFRRVLTSGILNYSTDVVWIKLALTEPNRSGGVMDAPTTKFAIYVPELDVDKKISIRSPRSELKHYPDIIEYQLIVALEDEILGFLPKDDLFWSPKTR